MEPADIVGQARKRGTALYAAGKKLRVTNPGRLPDDLKEQLRKHKGEVVELLREEQDKPPALFAIKSAVLDGGVVVFRRDKGVSIPSRYRRFPSYTFEEVRILLEDVKSKGLLRKVHKIKQTFDGWIIPLREKEEAG